MRILVVDDDRAVRESLRRSLSFNGYTVDLAEDGVEALDAIANERPDAVVLDVMMPRLDGLEVNADGYLATYTSRAPITPDIKAISVRLDSKEGSTPRLEACFSARLRPSHSPAKSTSPGT